MVMRYTLCVGDAPVTGGAVLPYDGPSNTISGHQAAPIGGKVRCEECDSIGIIIKAGGPRRQKMGVNGVQALDGDLCLCECSPPPPIRATMQSTMRYCDDAYGLPELTPNTAYDEQLRLQNEEGEFFKNFKYKLTLDDGSYVSGTTDEHGRTERVETDEPIGIKQVDIFAQTKTCCSIGNAPIYAADTPSQGAYSYTPTKKILTNPEMLGMSLATLILPRKPRALTAGEIAMAKTVFKDSIDYSKVKVHAGTYIAGQRDDTAMTPNGEMYFPVKVYEPDFSQGDKSFFIHELTHVWQFQLGYSVRTNGLIIAKNGGYSGGLPAYNYKPYIASRVDLKDFNMEQQARIIQYYFDGTETNNSRIKYILSRFLSNPKDATLLPATTDF